jgi:hypothetical protein
MPCAACRRRSSRPTPARRPLRAARPRVERYRGLRLSKPDALAPVEPVETRRTIAA